MRTLGLSWRKMFYFPPNLVLSAKCVPLLCVRVMDSYFICCSNPSKFSPLLLIRFKQIWILFKRWPKYYLYLINFRCRGFGVHGFLDLRRFRLSSGCDALFQCWNSLRFRFGWFWGFGCRFRRFWGFLDNYFFSSHVSVEGGIRGWRIWENGSAGGATSRFRTVASEAMMLSNQQKERNFQKKKK